jgi:hypothetical protein
VALREPSPNPAAETTPELRHVELLMKAIEFTMAQPAAAPMRLILSKFSLESQACSKSSTFAHRGSMVIRTICDTFADGFAGIPARRPACAPLRYSGTALTVSASAAAQSSTCGGNVGIDGERHLG